MFIVINVIIYISNEIKSQKSSRGVVNDSALHQPDSFSGLSLLVPVPFILAP